MKHRSALFAIGLAVAGLCVALQTGAQTPSTAAPASAASAAGAAPAPTAPTAPMGLQRDGDYLIFVIDSSGSMRRYAWDRVVRQLSETLDVYGTLAGIQVVNDEGSELLQDFRGEWIPDTPANRERILRELQDWESYSNSNPGAGIIRVLDRYFDPDKQIAIHVYGDDFSHVSSASINGIVADVERRNQAGNGRAPVPIHAVAFPVYWDQTGQVGTSGDYATLMRSLSEGSGGSFFALPSASALATPREPVTGLVAGAARTLLLVDSGAAADEARWQRVMAAVDRMTTGLGAGRSYQIVAFDRAASVVIAGTDGRWLDAGDGATQTSALAALRRQDPGEDSSLESALATIADFALPPDHVVLLVDRLPTLAAGGTAVRSGVEIMEALVAAGRSLPPGLPLSVLLFGDETGAPLASGYWALALASGGSLLSPARESL